MTIRTAALALALGAAGLAAPAQAQYAPYPAYPQTSYPQPGPYIPYAEPPADNRVFSGARAEVHLAYDNLRTDLEDRSVYAPRDRHGLGYGGEVGFDIPVGRVLTLGGYVGADGSTVRECGPVVNGSTLCLRPGRYLSAGGRVGLTLGRGILVYGKGGYTNGQLRASLRNPFDPASNADTHANGDGFHVGGGIEAAFTRRAYGKIDYVYSRLRRVGADDDNEFGIDVERQLVQAGVGLRF